MLVDAAPAVSLSACDDADVAAIYVDGGMIERGADGGVFVEPDGGLAIGQGLAGGVLAFYPGLSSFVLAQLGQSGSNGTLVHRFYSEHSLTIPGGVPSGFTFAATNVALRDFVVRPTGEIAALIQDSQGPHLAVVGTGQTYSPVATCGLNFPEARQLAFAPLSGGTWIVESGAGAGNDFASCVAMPFADGGGTSIKIDEGSSIPVVLGAVAVDASTNDVYVGGSWANKPFVAINPTSASALHGLIPVPAAGDGRIVAIDARDGSFAFVYEAADAGEFVAAGWPDGGLRGEPSSIPGFLPEPGGYLIGRPLAIASDGQVWFTTDAGVLRWTP